MSKENESNERKPDVTEKKKEEKPKKELTPQEIQKRKKMLVYPLFFLIFAGVMWIIFAPSGDKNDEQPDGFNSELPIPKDEAIVGDKRTAYEQEAMQNKQNEKMRSLQDFAFMLGEEESRKAQEVNTSIPSDNQEVPTNNRTPQTGIQSSASAYQDVNRQLNDWYEQPATQADNQAQLEMESRIQELERQLAEKSAADGQLELIEKSYAIAAKYMPNGQPEQVQPVDNTINLKEKVIPKPVSQVHQSVVSLLAAPMENDDFLEQYSKPRNMGFITAAGNETVTDKNSIRAAVYQTVTISNGKELQLRLLEPMRAGHILIPANSILTGSAKIGGERLHITITSIQYADNVIPVEMEVYDMDGMQGIFVPNSDEVTAMKEIAANMGTSMGSSITITDDAGSQLAADLGRSLIQGTSQFFSKKMREVKVTLKAGYKVLLLPKA
ncbi:conjugative transposon protein TraM [Seramator thermalis]|uniref:conjugative transposon protein TraM n=1 Tax=Seramator thermalis TaxID=2496270 RepID=UPI00101C1A32|nr:conjugative transposon protein TraM [Seramator thermalis]MDD3063286.1 conjugative transposon protein TraM [Massilibacteroides sp.]MDD4661073.1 conjugative transposon protein TraM [Massilibacteroides sp.]